MQTQSPAQQREPEPSLGSGEIAEGLMLWRASTLRMIRLQLAMEQGDRRATLETVDELVALDRQLQDYLAPHVPAAVTAELEAERAALNREKLTLAAGVIRREAPAPAAVPEADAPAWGSRDYALADQRRRRRGLRWLAGALILVAAAGGAAFVPGVADRVQAVVAGAAR
jgi:hypothetical protein